MAVATLLGPIGILAFFAARIHTATTYLDTSHYQSEL
jgi:hypothetical protein